MKILFVDDMKQPHHFNLPNDTPHAVDAEHAYKMWKSFGPYDELWLDHDLTQHGMNGYQLLKKLHYEHIPPKKVVCISYNPVGVENIQKFC